MKMRTKVSLKETVDYETLEAALIKAAEEVGWEAKVEDQYREVYKLGSVGVTQEYIFTEVKLRRRRPITSVERLVTLGGRLLPLREKLFPVATVELFNKEPSDRFDICTDGSSYYGDASKGQVEQYLAAVSRELYG